MNNELSHKDDHGTDDTGRTFNMMEDGASTFSREMNAQKAARQEKFVMSLENALLRIKNKTYGVCRVTGKLINKKRLMLVPHATLSIEAKINNSPKILKKVALITFIILLLDQVVKIYVKSTMTIGQDGFDIWFLRLILLKIMGWLLEQN